MQDKNDGPHMKDHKLVEAAGDRDAQYQKDYLRKQHAMNNNIQPGAPTQSPAPTGWTGEGT